MSRGEVDAKSVRDRVMRIGGRAVDRRGGLVVRRSAAARDSFEDCPRVARASALMKVECSQHTLTKA